MGEGDRTHEQRDAEGVEMSRGKGGTHGPKRFSDVSLADVQVESRAWWEQNPMTYDWSGHDGGQPGSESWFDHQDRRSHAEHMHFLGGRPAFEHVLPRHTLDGLNVLEIGVGSGYQAEQLTRAGANVTGIDIAEPAVTLSQTRFEIKQLTATVERWDAEEDRPDFHGRFDLVWSWGVIHHSAHTARIVRNVSGWLRPEGTFAGMVYHRDSSRLPIALLRDWVMAGNWRRHTVDEALWRGSDGFSARFYPADQWRDLLLAFFEEADTRVQGLDVDVVPLPRAVRPLLWRRMSLATRNRMLQRLGHFLMFRASQPR
jgi:2-polyprenyl-3-methyl-5-hydroxy-6-metoxy-1,4-benzoquinol methylase